MIGLKCEIRAKIILIPDYLNIYIKNYHNSTYQLGRFFVSVYVFQEFYCNIADISFQSHYNWQNKDVYSSIDHGSRHACRLSSAEA